MSDTLMHTMPKTFGVFGPRWHVRVRAVTHAERRALCRGAERLRLTARPAPAGSPAQQAKSK